MYSLLFDYSVICHMSYVCVKSQTVSSRAFHSKVRKEKLCQRLYEFYTFLLLFLPFVNVCHFKTRQNVSCWKNTNRLRELHTTYRPPQGSVLMDSVRRLTRPRVYSPRRKVIVPFNEF